MELQELAKKVGVKNIIVSHYNDMHFKDNITIIVNNDILINLVGKTYSTVPLTTNGIDKTINTSSLRKLLDTIKTELADKKF